MELIRQCIELESDLAAEQKQGMLARIDKALLRWPAWSVQRVLYTYCLPLVSPVVGICTLAFPAIRSPVTGAIVLTTLGYALGWIASGFVVKRGLMLGGSDNSACYPANLSGRGAYELEETVLSLFEVRRREFPLDFALTAMVFPVQIVSAIALYNTGFYNVLQSTLDQPQSFVASKLYVVAQSSFVGALLVVVGMVSLTRRAKLRRS